MPIHFNAFTQCSAALQSFGQWKNPRERTPRGYTDVRFWIELAQLLERGCFDAQSRHESCRQYPMHWKLWHWRQPYPSG